MHIHHCFCGLRPSALTVLLFGVFCFLLPDAPGQERTAPAPPWAGYSRADLPQLSPLSPAKVLDVLGTFDDRGMSEKDFIQRAFATVIDTGRVPGLAEARERGDTQAMLDSLVKACSGPKENEEEQSEIPSKVIANADKIMAHKLSFYGEEYQLPPEIDWSHNPGTEHWLNQVHRFSYLRPLTEAYLATGDAKYSRKAVWFILDWIEKNNIINCFNQNPSHPAFRTYITPAIHCTAWASCIKTLAAHGQVSGVELLRILKSIREQLAFVAIGANKQAFNHSLIGYRNILACTVHLPMLCDAAAFIDCAARGMEEQATDQVLPDGVQIELTTHYHRLATWALISTALSLAESERSLTPRALEVLRNMVRYCQQTTLPDGSTVVAFSDADSKYPRMSKIDDSLRQIGAGDFILPPDKIGPEVFPYAGVAFLRQRQSKGDLYMAFDAGPYGTHHQHEDKLGFWLYAYGRNFIVDPGRHLYDRDPSKSYWTYLKSTTAHSTIKIDHEGQNSAGKRGTKVAKKPIDMGWVCKEGEEVRATGLYKHGYGADNKVKAVHHREIVFIKDRFWIVFDSVEGGGDSHHVESRFQYAPGDLVVSGNTARTQYNGANLLLVAAPTAPFADIHVEKGQEKPARGGWYSPVIGKIEPAPALSMSLHAQMPWRCATLLLPYRGTRAPEVSFTFDGKTAVIDFPETGKVSVECSLK